MHWCDQVCSGGQVANDSGRLQDVADLRSPYSVGELKQFLQAVNWLRLPRLAEVVEPLRRLLVENMASAPRRTKPIVSNRAIKREARTAGTVKA